jgi:hypothetical protein
MHPIFGYVAVAVTGRRGCWFSSQPLVAGRSAGRQALGTIDSISNYQHLINYI